MGQSATLYRIKKEDFSKIEETPDDFGLFKITAGYETFEKTHEGLRFIISKFDTSQDKNSATEIFYPKTSVGEEIDYANVDFENLPDNFDALRQPVYYLTPEKIKEINLLLAKISIEDFGNIFKPEELNEEKIYPYGIWNHRTEENACFNKRDMTLEFERLKVFFEIAKGNNDYILSYVG